MVVQFALEKTAESVDASAADERHPVKKKYLVGRSREKKNSMFDYVHLSSSLLRKIRYGQSLDAVLEARSPWSSDDSSRPQSSSSVLGFKAPQCAWRSASSTPTRVHEKSLNQRTETALPAEGTIQYGRAIQLQATDGGFLAIDDDGSLFKLPKTQRGDSRTLLTLFPQDPLRPPASKPCVSTGELCFMVLGAATIGAHHQVLYADSREIIEPPATLRDAVQGHRREHGGGESRIRGQGPVVCKTGSPFTAWSFRPPPDRDGCEEMMMVTGSMVQLTQVRRTLHYEMERIVKRKYTPISSGGPETAEPDGPSSPATASTRGASTDAGDGPRQTKPATFTHVWLHQNDLPAQHGTSRSSKGLESANRHKRWDNLWFIIDVATDRRLERERKQRLAVQEAAEEAEAERDEASDDSDDARPSHPLLPRHHNKLPTTVESEEGPSNTQKRASVMNAHVFVGQAAGDAQSRAAAIIVRFLRRVSRREAERRAKYLIERRIRRTGKLHRGSDNGCGDIQLSTMQQLRVLQCFKPTVYGSQRLEEPKASPSRRISGVSLQGSKFPAQETRRLASMQRDLLYLGTSHFQQQQTVLRRHPAPHHDLRQQFHEPLTTNLRTKHHQHISRERERERGQKLHVQLAMAHREKPHFHFGKHALSLPQHLHHQRPHTAPGSPSPKA